MKSRMDYLLSFDPEKKDQLNAKHFSLKKKKSKLMSAVETCVFKPQTRS